MKCLKKNLLCLCLIKNNKTTMLTCQTQNLGSMAEEKKINAIGYKILVNFERSSHLC